MHLWRKNCIQPRHELKYPRCKPLICLYVEYVGFWLQTRMKGRHKPREKLSPEASALAFLEEIVPRRKLFHDMIAAGIELAERLEAVVPAEEGPLVESELLANVLAPLRDNRMHEQSANPKQVSRIGKHLAPCALIAGRLRRRDAVGPYLVRVTDELVHQRHDRMQLGLFHRAIVAGKDLMDAGDDLGRRFVQGDLAIEIALRLV